MKTWRIVPVLAALMGAAACQGTKSDEGLVARAGDQEFTVDQAVNLLVDQENLPNQADVVHALGDIWIDYTLLAQAVAKDSTLKQLDLAPLVRQQLDQQMIAQHMDSVLQVDTSITDQELRQAYETEAPDAKIHVSHILLAYPDQATQAQRDSVRAELEGIRRRILAGESFADLARQYSQDPGSASKGGDLGTVSRGDVVRPFADAAFALEPGQISDVVETPFGLHLIRVDSKEAAGFDQVKDQFRLRMKNQRFLDAESTYVATLEEKLQPETAEGAFDLMKELAKDPGTQLSGRAATRPLVSFKGGKYTVGEYLTFVQSQQPQFRGRIQNATSEQLKSFLDNLSQRRMLISEASSAGLAPSQQRVDSLVQETRKQVLQAANEIGLRRLDRAPGEALGPAIGRVVNSALSNILTGASNVVPLGAIAFQLRAGVATSIYDAGVGQAVMRIGQIRSTRRPSPAEMADSTAARDSTARDTTGNP